MHMVVDRAGKEMKAVCVQGFPRARHRIRRADGENDAILDGNAGVHGGLRRDHRSVIDDEIRRDVHDRDS